MRTTLVAFAATFFVVMAGFALPQDPVPLSPRMYTVLLENEHVRVYEFRCKPGEKEPMHSHPAMVVYSLTASKFRSTGRDGVTAEGETKPGTAEWVEAMTHSWECLPPGEQRTIITELKGLGDGAGAGGEGSLSTDVRGINATLREYVAAVNAADAAAYGMTLTDDVVFMPPDSPRLMGRDAVVAWVTRDFFDRFNTQFQAAFDDVHVRGSQALASGTFSLDLAPKAGGTRIRTTGKFMNVFRKQTDGSWRYARAIFNFDKPLA